MVRALQHDYRQGEPHVLVLGHTFRFMPGFSNRIVHESITWLVWRIDSSSCP